MSKLGFIVDAGNGEPAYANGGIIDENNGIGARANGGFIDPATGQPANTAGDGQTKRRRGRPPGSKTKNTSEETVSVKRPIDAEGLTAILLAIHMGIASLTKIPELELEEPEAAKLANAAKDVMKHYDVVATEKTLAWTHLGVVMFSTYTPRVLALRLAAAAEKNKQTAAPQATNPNVVRMQP